MPLLDLALSHNKLRGDIPTQFQQKRWYQLDLSYNRLTGTLRSDFGTVASELTDDDAIESFNATGELDTYILSLEDNRISGRIPQKVQQLTDVSILGSNLFSCNLMHTNLPEHDSEASKYSCGSSSFDVPYYVWLSITAAALVAAAVAGWYFRAHPTVSDVISRLQRWHGAANGISGRGVSDLHILHVALLSRMTTDFVHDRAKVRGIHPGRPAAIVRWAQPALQRHDTPVLLHCLFCVFVWPSPRCDGVRCIDSSALPVPGLFHDSHRKIRHLHPRDQLLAEASEASQPTIAGRPTQTRHLAP
jgi:hypothetical protein